jgi:hypothetical protein
MAAKLRVLTVRVVPEESETKVTAELGLGVQERKIPAGMGIVRFAAILNDKAELVDFELVTDKL